MDYNHTIILTIGEKLHISTCRNFAGDHSRHFVGVVITTHGSMARLKGLTFSFDPKSGNYEKLSEVRTRIFGVEDGRHTINVLPPHAILETLQYKVIDGRLIMTDGQKFSMDANEFKAEG